VHYQSDCVTHNGASYQAIRDTASAPPGEDWICLATAGRDAVVPTIRSTYSPTETYHHLDIVVCDGSAFIARKDDPGECPGAGWQMIAKAGKPGKQGQQGLRGEAGQRGPQGERGASVIDWKIDRERFTVTPIMSDGSKGVSLNLRDLFEQFQIETR
jgi:hypothetical protein